MARALYGEPALVVLDEPNSNLDELGEVALQRAVMELKQRGATVVIVSHRGSILNAVDKLLLLVDGSLHMYGPRDEVIAAMQKKSGQLAPRPSVTQGVAGSQPA